MRKIPDHITDTAALAKLNDLNLQIEAKMKNVNVLRDQMKKKELAPNQMQDLKKISMEIDSLDREWKSIVGL